FDLDSGATVHVQNVGTVLRITDRSSLAGNLSADAGTTFLFDNSAASPSINLNAGTTFAGAGTFQLGNFGIVQVNAPLALPQNFVAVGAGVLTCNADV